MTFDSAKTDYATIHIAGDYEQAKQVCREFTKREGQCVTVTPTTYIYTGGEEAGVTVRFVNYPRFKDRDLLGTARWLADELKTRLCQWSYLIETPTVTHWISDKPEHATTPTNE